MLQQIPMKVYIESLLYNKDRIKGFITPSTNGVAYTLDYKAFCRIEEDMKLKGIWLHGLFSIEKGYGAKLLREILKNANADIVRLNCYEELVDYYKLFGFDVYFSYKNYYEMIKYK